MARSAPRRQKLSGRSPHPRTLLRHTAHEELSSPRLNLQSWCRTAACSLCCAWLQSCWTSPSRRRTPTVRLGAWRAWGADSASAVLPSGPSCACRQPTGSEGAACSWCCQPSACLLCGVLHCCRRGEEGVAQPIPAVRPGAVGGRPGRWVGARGCPDFGRGAARELRKQLAKSSVVWHVSCSSHWRRHSASASRPLLDPLPFLPRSIARAAAEQGEEGRVLSPWVAAGVHGQPLVSTVMARAAVCPTSISSMAGVTPTLHRPPTPTPLQFNIVPWHCLVVTAEYRSQLDDLDAADLAATWAVVQVRRGADGCGCLQSGSAACTFCSCAGA